MLVFDIALEKRFVESDEIALVDVTSADTLLIRDSTTGAVMRLPFSTLVSAISSAFSGTFASLVDGKVPASQLPSYVDDVLEYANFASFPATGESGKIYVTLDTNETYRWSGSAYVEISQSLALGETSSTAYRGDHGKTAYDHSQLTSGNPHGTTKSDVGLGNVDNTRDENKPVSTAQQTALDLKANAAQAAWTAATMVNSWVDFGAPYGTVAYYKDTTGVVRMKGCAKSGTASLVTTLPAGYRPASTIRFATVINGVFGYVQIDSSGNVTSSSNNPVFFDVVQFRPA